MIDLRLHIASVVIAQPFSQQRAGNTAGAADQRCRNDGGDNCSAGKDDCACSTGGASVGKATHYTALSISNRLRRDICRARNSRVVFENAGVGKATAKLFIHRVIAGE